MEDFNSKYTGEQVEALLDIVSQGGVGGGGGEGEVQKTTETEILAMGFTKNQGTITEVKMNGVSKGTSGIVDLGTVITEHQDISGKQDSIDDLDAIREGASKGATALQSIPDEYITETELEGKGYAEAIDLDGKVDKVTGKGLSTEDFTAALKSKLESLSNYDDTEINNAVAGLQSQIDTLVGGNATEAIDSFNEIIAFLNGITNSEDLDSIIASIEQQIASKQDTIADLATIRSGAEKGASAVQPSSLATVATSGSYNDLSNKPTIPSAVTESTVSGWGFTKNTGTYSKPSGGIPKSDLTSDVQTSLGKADTALQEHQTLKTINGQSLVGGGDITISGGGGGTSGGGKEFVEIEPDFAPDGYYGVFSDSIPLQPNKVYVFTEALVNLSVHNIETSWEIGDEYTIMFTAGSSSISISISTIDSTVYWANGAIPPISEGDMCELSLVRIGNNYKAVLTTFKPVG